MSTLPQNKPVRSINGLRSVNWHELFEKLSSSFKTCQLFCPRTGRTRQNARRPRRAMSADEAATRAQERSYQRVDAVVPAVCCLSSERI